MMLLTTAGIFADTPISASAPTGAKGLPPETPPIPAVAPVTAAPLWTSKEVTELRKQASESSSLTDETRTSLLRVFDNALEQLKRCEQYRTQKETYIRLRQQAPAELEMTLSELTRLADEAPPQIRPDTTIADLRVQVAAARAEYRNSERKSAVLKRVSSRRAVRRTNIPAETAAAQAELRDTEKKLASPPVTGEGPELSRARRMLLGIQREALKLKLEMLNEESLYYGAGRSLLAVRRDLAARNLARAARRLNFLQGALEEARFAQARKVESAARSAAAIQYAHGLVEEVAEDNVRLAALLHRVSEKIEQSRLYGRQLERQTKALDVDYIQVQERVEAAEQITRDMGVLLAAKKKEMPDVATNVQRTRARKNEVTNARSTWADLDRRWAQMADVEAFAKALIAASGVDGSDPNYAAVLRQTSGLLAEQRKIIRRVCDDYLDYSEVLARTDEWEKRLVQTTNEYRSLIDRTMLRIRKTSRLSLRDLGLILPAMRWLISPDNWREVGRLLVKDAAEHPVIYVSFFVAVLIMVLTRPRTRRVMTGLTELVMHKYSDSFVHTWKTFGITLVLTVTYPAIVMFFAWRIRLLSGDDDFAYALSVALRGCGVLLAVFAFVKHFCYPGALGCQLGFSKEMLRSLHRHCIWFFSLIIPITFLEQLFRYEKTDPLWESTVAYLNFALGLIAFSIFLLIILRPGGKVLRGHMESKPQGWLSRTRYIWYGMLLVFPVLLLVISLSGYMDTAQRLTDSFVYVMLLVGIASFLSAMLHRWTASVHTRMQLRQRRRQLMARRSRQAEPWGGEPTGIGATLSGVSEKTAEVFDTIFLRVSRLMRLVIVLFIAVGLWAIWHDILPFLEILHDIKLWSTTNSSGSPKTIDAASIAMALGCLLLTIVMSRNLPGLLQVAVLGRLPLDAGVRFAIIALFRYSIVIVGAIVTFNIIGVSWSKIQWLVAAVTVGLGFGLQEIFANFVSGLIILFERPVRVGDTVTIGDIEGKVTMIRIRATTIRKWDGKELIVPNKDFVTGRLINWTHSDRALRMEFAVGVAYGSDIEKAEQTLYAVAAANPLVIKEDPSPIVLFRAFGDSSLQFELRLFIYGVDHRLKVWHEINCAIDTEFRKANIEIAYPQRDLHLRSTDIPFPPK